MLLCNDGEISSSVLFIIIITIKSRGCWGGGFSLLHGNHPNPAAPKLQHTSKQEHTTNVVIQ
jgi:hypothetical protein